MAVWSRGLNRVVGYLHFSHIVRTVEGLRSSDAVVWQFVTECWWDSGVFRCTHLPKRCIIIVALFHVSCPMFILVWMKTCREVVSDIAGWKENNWYTPIFWSIRYVLHLVCCLLKVHLWSRVFTCNYFYNSFWAIVCHQLRLEAHNELIWYLVETANVVLEGALERITVGELYCDLPLGLYIIRGENVVLIGELVSFALNLFISFLRQPFLPWILTFTGCLSWPWSFFLYWLTNLGIKTENQKRHLTACFTFLFDHCRILTGRSCHPLWCSSPLLKSSR